MSPGGLTRLMIIEDHGVGPEFFGQGDRLGFSTAETLRCHEAPDFGLVGDSPRDDPVSIGHLPGSRLALAGGHLLVHGVWDHNDPEQRLEQIERTDRSETDERRGIRDGRHLRAGFLRLLFTWLVSRLAARTSRASSSSL